MRLLASALACLVLLAACGGSSEPPKIQDVADSIGCKNFDIDPGGQALTREIGSCQIDGQDVYVHTFSDSDQQQQWLDAAGAGGGIFVKGELWVVQTFDAETADAVADSAGGEVVS